jgi:hypothetical protein
MDVTAALGPLGPYTKAIAALVISAIGAVVAVLGTGDMSLGDLDARAWIEIIIAILASGGLTWFVQNTAAGPLIKTLQASLTAGFTALLAGYQDGVITQGELLTALGAAIAASGFVYQLRNAGEPQPAPVQATTVAAGKPT